MYSRSLLDLDELELELTVSSTSTAVQSVGCFGGSGGERTRKRWARGSTCRRSGDEAGSRI